ncbi:hypothetical protein ACFL59_03800 [Planctomycetota bacterium]
MKKPRKQGNPGIGKGRPLAGTKQLPGLGGAARREDRPLAGTKQLPRFGSAARPEGQLHYRRKLAFALDSAVRSVVQDPDELERLCVECADAFEEHPDAVLTIRPTELLVDEEVGLEAGTDGGSWLLPAFVAGLRQLQFSPRLSADNIGSLAFELAALDHSLETIRHFRDWIWFEGAEGFRVGFDRSLAETDDLSDVDPEWLAPFLESPESHVAELIPETRLVPAWDLDANAERSPYQVHLDLFDADFKKGSYNLDPEARKRLEDECRDEGAWALAEVGTVLARKDLQGTVPPERLAWRILTLMSDRVERSHLSLLERLFGENDTYCEAVAEALCEEGVGDVVASGFDATTASREDLVGFARSVPQPVVEPLLTGLLARGDDEGAREVAAILVSQLGTPELNSMLEHLSTNPAAAVHLVRISAASGGASVDGTLLRPLVLSVPPEERVALLLELPAELFVDLREAVKEALACAAQPAQLELIAHLEEGSLGTGRRWVAEILAESVRDPRAWKWSMTTLKATFEAIIRCGSGRDVVVPYTQDRSAPSTCRVAAFEVLYGHRELLALAVKTRLSMLLEPPEIQRCLRIAKRRLDS